MTPSASTAPVPSFDPRVTIPALIVLSVTAGVADDPAVLGGILLLLAAFLAAVRVPPWKVLRSTGAVAWFAAAAVGVSAVTVPGEVLLRIGDLYVTEAGVMEGLTLAGRLVLLAWLSSAYVLATPLVRTMDGIAALLRPFTRGRAQLVIVAGLALAFVPMLVQTAKRVRAARVARGEPEGRGYVSNIRFAAAASVPLFAAVFRSADEVAVAMEARCFDPSQPRTSYARLSIGPADRVVITAVIVWAVASVLIAARIS
jgi:energy-coupling factor transport system permease protein